MPEVRNRIIEKLKRHMSASVAESTYQKLAFGNAGAAFAKAFNQNRSLILSGGLLVEKFYENTGFKIAGSVAEYVAPSVARLTVKTRTQSIVKAAGSSIFKNTGKSFFVAGSAIFGALFTDMLMPSESSAEDTQDAVYAKNPYMLLSLSPEYANPYIQKYPAICKSILNIRDILEFNQYNDSSLDLNDSFEVNSSCGQ